MKRVTSYLLILSSVFCLSGCLKSKVISKSVNESSYGDASLNDSTDGNEQNCVHSMVKVHNDGNCFANGYDGEYCQKCGYEEIEEIESHHNLNTSGICKVCGTKVMTLQEYKEILGYRSYFSGYEKIEINAVDYSDYAVSNFSFDEDVKTVILKGHGHTFTKLSAKGDLTLFLNNANFKGYQSSGVLPCIKVDGDLSLYVTGENTLIGGNAKNGDKGNYISGGINGKNGTDNTVGTIEANNVYLFAGCRSKLTIQGGNGGNGGNGDYNNVSGSSGSGGNGGNGSYAINGNLYVENIDDKNEYAQYLGTGGLIKLAGGLGGTGGYSGIASYESSSKRKKAQDGEQGFVSYNINVASYEKGNYADFSHEGESVEKVEEQQPDPQHEHFWVVEEEGYDATCMTNGITESVKCLSCGEYRVIPQVIPRLGHDFENGYCARCDMKQYATLQELMDDSDAYFVEDSEDYSTLYVSPKYTKLDLTLNDEYAHKDICINAENVTYISFKGDGNTLYNTSFDIVNVKDSIVINLSNVRITHDTSRVTIPYMFHCIKPVYLYSSTDNELISVDGKNGSNGKDSLLGDGENGGNGESPSSIFDFKETYLYSLSGRLTARAGSGGNGGNGGMSSGVFNKDGDGGNGGNGGYVFTGDLFIDHSEKDKYVRTYGNYGYLSLRAGKGGKAGKKPSGSLGKSGQDGIDGLDGYLAKNNNATAMERLSIA